MKTFWNTFNIPNKQHRPIGISPYWALFSLYFDKAGISVSNVNFTNDSVYHK